MDYMKDWLRYRYEQEDIPGFVVAVAHKGKVLFNEAYGYADLEKKEKLTPEHIFRIASHSKTFTATAVMQLQEQGKLKVSDPVVKYLPWLKKHKDKRWLQVTIKQLLSHGAGVIRDGLDSDYWRLHKPFPNETQLKQEFLGTGLILKPNQKMKYSNYGYSILGLVIEAASGQPYNNYVVDNIIRQLGLKNTYPEFSEKIKTRVVTGYTRGDYKRKRLPIANIDTQAMSPATGFCATSKDLCSYFAAHFIGSGKLLKDESKESMQGAQWPIKYRKNKEEYGLGIDISYVGKRRLFGHSGGFPGQNTKTLCDTKNELIVVVMTNAIQGGASNIARNVVKLIDGFQIGENLDTDKNLTKFEGRFMSMWSVVDFIARGKKLVCASPDWEPFDKPDELKKVDATIFQVSKTNSYGSEGELVHFNFSSPDKIQSVIYAGEKLLPEKEYLREIAAKKRIG